MIVGSLVTLLPGRLRPQPPPLTHQHGAVPRGRVDPAAGRQPSGDVFYDELGGSHRSGEADHKLSLAVEGVTLARLHVRLWSGHGVRQACGARRSE